MNKYLRQFWLFLYSKILLVTNYINNMMTNYINYISQEVNNPHTDAFERFYYNLFIFVYWTVLRIKQLIFNLTMLIGVEWKLKKIQIYELIFGNKNFPLSTPNLFYSVLKEIPESSNILDFGCGSGICYKKIDTINLIVKSNHRITGIDINKFAINKFQNKINSNSLAGKIDLKCGDIFAMKINEKFDYVIFSESAPLLSPEFLIQVSSHIKTNLLKEGGKLIFINNLAENPQFITRVIKPKLKYITTIDFGRVIVKNEFDNLALANQMKVKFELLDSLTVEQVAKFYNISIIYKIFNIFGLKNYDVAQYKITLE
jgi:SAM-dependent methyltransferase